MWSGTLIYDELSENCARSLFSCVSEKVERPATRANDIYSLDPYL